MTETITANSRVTKILAETGKSFEESETFLNKQTLIIHIDEDQARTPAGQAAASTAVATARRCFLGGVELRGFLSEKWVLNSLFGTLGNAAKDLGSIVSEDSTFHIFIGRVPPGFKGKGVQVWWDRWRVGIRPAHSPQNYGSGKVPLAGIAAASIGVSQAFSFVTGNKAAGNEPWDVNLWDPNDKEGVGPKSVRLPLRLWLLGLGNLGQAYLWSLLALPYAHPEKIFLVGQDDDSVKLENWITSILTTKDWVGRKKTELVAYWAEKRGFKFSKVELRLSKNFCQMGKETYYCLAGLDRMEARKLLAHCQFPFILSAGLGSTPANYHSFDLDVLDSVWGANQCYADAKDLGQELENLNLKKAAYKELIEAETDPVKRCGLVEIAGSSAAVPFVSAFVGAFAIIRAIQLASDIRPDRIFSGSTVQLANIRVHSDPELSKDHLGIYSEAMECA